VGQTRGRVPRILIHSDPDNTTLQLLQAVFYNLQKTCRLLAAVVKMYCSCIALMRTAAIQQFFSYVIVVVL